MTTGSCCCHEPDRLPAAAIRTLTPQGGGSGAASHQRRRKSTASRYLADFGVARYCGFGRQPGRDGSETVRDHQQTALAARD